MIEGERRGPYELDELVEAGVGPDTYVWCKGMDDWQKAEDVADICRFFRVRIFNLMHPAKISEPEVEPQPEDLQTQLSTASLEPVYDTSNPPFPTLFISILMTFFCFPITGLVAVYYSYKSRAAWAEAKAGESDKKNKMYDEGEREQLRRQAHDYARQARMWIGITFFLSFILYALISHKYF